MTVFISYTRQGADKEVATRLAQAISKYFSVWMDDQLEVGGCVNQAIECELENASCVVVLWSATSKTSAWVNGEFQTAVSSRKAVPLALDEATPPIFAKTIKFAQMQDWSGEEDHLGFKKMMAVITRHESSARRQAFDEPPVYLDSASTATVISSIREFLDSTKEWRASTLRALAAPCDPQSKLKIGETLMEYLDGHRSLTQLGVLHHTLCWLGVPVQYDQYFISCNRWPPPKFSGRYSYVPPGDYQIGSPEVEPNRCPDEHQQKVSISGFFMAEVPVTNAEFLKFAPDHPVRRWTDVPIDELMRHPVVRLNWWEAYLYCQWVGGRLPTEAEWEIACRGGSTSPFSIGSTLSPEEANFNCGTAAALRRTIPVGRHLQSNEFGLMDMHGNVWEWCEDTFSENFFAINRGLDPVCLDAGINKVARGGSWDDPSHAARSAFRNRFNPYHRLDNFGFRVVRG